jgi:putative ABC transport system permease protein
MLGIIIGVSAVISLLSIGQGVENFINSQFNALGTNLLFVLPKLSSSQGAQFVAQFANQTTLTQNDLRALGDPALVPDISNVSAQIRLDALARYADAKLTTAVRGVNPAYFVQRGLKVSDGRELEDEDVQTQARVAVIGQTVVDELFPPDASPLDRAIRVNDVPFRVVGVLEEKGGNQFANDDNQVIIPITTARAQLRDVRARNGLPGVTAILMQGADPNSSEVLRTDATSVLRAQHNISYRDEDDFRVFNQADLLQSFGAISAAITVFLLGHCGHLAAGGRHRRDEHHAGYRHRAHARDRAAQSDRGQAARHFDSIPGGGHDAVSGGRRDRHCDRRGRRGGRFQPVQAISAQRVTGYRVARDRRLSHGWVDRGTVSSAACRADASD